LEGQFSSQNEKSEGGENLIKTENEFMIGKLLRLHGVNLVQASSVSFGEQGHDRKILLELLQLHDQHEAEKFAEDS